MTFRLPILICLCVLLVGCGQTVTDQPTGVALPFSGSQLQERSDREPTSFVKIEPGKVTKTEYEATVINTDQFESRVWRTEPYKGDIRDVEGLRGDDADPPEIRRLAPNDLAVDGNVIDMDRIHPVSSFPGIDQSFFTPPDPTVCVGPNHIVQMVNSEIAFFTKDGQVTFQAPLGSQSNDGFFVDAGAEDFCVDPRCFYDHYENRFVVMCLEVYFDSNDSYLTLAVSDDDDPNGTWFRYRTDGVYQVNGDNNFADYPTFGYDQQGYYIAGNLFAIQTFQFNGTSIRTIDKTPLLDGEPIEVNDIVQSGFFTIQMTKSYDSPPVPLGVTFNSTTAATLVAVENPFINPTLVTTNVSVPSYNTSGEASNGSGLILVLGGRAMNAHVRDGRLYTCHSISDNGQELARWYEFELNGWPTSGSPTLVQSGDINLGAGQETYFPAIFANRNGSIALVYGNSSASDLASVRASGRNVSDPLGTMSVSEQFDISSAVANGRYGDYFDIAIDPADDSTFWVVGQTQEGFGWDTVINSFIVPALGDVNCDGAINLLDVQPFVDLLTTGGFSDKADFNGDGQVNLLDIAGFVDAISGG